MRSSQLSFKDYSTDKIDHGFLAQYDRFFEPLVDKEIVVLELGVHQGGSLLLWRDYFPFGRIVGIDIHLPKDFKPPSRIRVYEGSQSDCPFLTQVATEVAPDGFDIIIDDASHVGELTSAAFWHLFDHHLKLGGHYVIEDWGTGYWEDWSDGKSIRDQRRPPWRSKLAKTFHRKCPVPCHCYGMVGFVKQLVDEQGALDSTRKSSKGDPVRRSKFDSLTITPSIVFVRKRSVASE